MSKKYYWLKLKRDFFKRHDIVLMRAQENGGAMVLFYLSLLVESIDHNGYLRYSDDVPYSEDELSTVTSTLHDVTEPAIKYFKEKKLMIIEEDGTIYMPQAVELIGSESDSAERVRRFRQKNCDSGNVNVTGCNGDVTKSNTELELDKELDKEKEVGKRKRFIPSFDFIEDEEWENIWKEWVENKKGPYHKQLGVEKGFSELVRKSTGNIEWARRIVDHSLAASYQGLFPPDDIKREIEEAEEAKKREERINAI